MLSINIESWRTDQKVNDIIEEFSLSRSVITNPINLEEETYKVQIDDTLIVLARYEKDILKAQKNLKNLK